MPENRAACVLLPMAWARHPNAVWLSNTWPARPTPSITHTLVGTPSRLRLPSSLQKIRRPDELIAGGQPQNSAHAEQRADDADLVDRSQSAPNNDVWTWHVGFGNWVTTLAWVKRSGKSHWDPVRCSAHCCH